MAHLTALQAEAYARAYTNELDSAKVTQAEIIIWLTLAQRKVQMDIEAIGLKTFTKTVVLNGGIASLPSDLRDHNDAIRSIVCAVGAFGDRAYFNSNFSVANAEVTLQSVKPGTAGNGGILTIMDSTDPGGKPHGTIQFEGLAPWDFDIWLDSGIDITANTLISFLMANPQFREHATIFLQDGNDGTGNVNNTGYSMTTAGASGTTSWIKPREITPEEYDLFTTSSSVYKDPSATAPAFCVKGDAAGGKTIFFIPNSPPASAVWTSKITYEYLVSDVTSTGSLSIPVEYEELVLIETIGKMFDKLDNAEKRAEANIKYQTKIKELQDMYQRKLGSRVQEKKRIQATDVEN